MTLFLSGCGGKNDGLDRAMSLRSRLLAGSVSFDAVVTADYGDDLYTFSMCCQADTRGQVSFTVTEPETISGISGSIDASVGKLRFDDQVLTFPLMADDQLSPVSAPWILMRTLRSGYLTSAGMEGEYLRLSIDDSYDDDALHLDIWLNELDHPIRAEVIWQGRSLLSIEVKNFTFL